MMVSSRFKLKRLIPITFSVAVIFWAFACLYGELKTISYKDTLHYFKNYPSPLIVISIILTILSYVLISSYEWLGLKHLSKSIQFKKILRISFLANTFSNNIGSSALAGPFLRHRLYSGLGIGVLDAAQMVLFVNTTIILGALTLGGACFLLAPFQINVIPTLGQIPPVFIGVILLMIPIGYLGGCSIGFHPLNWNNWQIKFPKFKIGLMQIIFSALDWMLAVSVLYILCISFKIPFIVFCGVFVFAQIAGLASQVPAGIGVFEAIMLSGLSAWVPAENIIGILLIYRLIYHLLPLSISVFVLFQGTISRSGNIAGKVGSQLTAMSAQLMPPFMAVMSFVAGVTLLFSGALPTASNRIAFLKTFVPLSAIEISHFLGSITGLILILLSRAIQKRIDLAYYMCLGLFLVGALFSVIKGYDYEEAFILTICFIIFLPSKKYFLKRSQLSQDFVSPKWLLSIITVILSVIWITLFAYKHVEYTDELWWTFSFNSQAPRSMRTMVVVVIVFCFVVLWRLTKISRLKSASSDADLSFVRDIIKTTSNPIANVALLGDKQFILSPSKQSFLMYAAQGDTYVALGDPIGPEEE